MSKSPGISRVKTRLEKSSSQIVARQFFDLALAAVQSVPVQLNMRRYQFNDLYMALAEEEACRCYRWSGFSNLWQGDGGLGERLDRVYSQLISSSQYAVIVGMDSPQITAEFYLKAIELLQSVDIVVGPSRDGGFYLLAGRIEIPLHVWTSTRYSSHQTLESFLSLLPRGVSVGRLPLLTDVDEYQDLSVLKNELFQVTAPTIEQLELRIWLQRLLEGSNQAIDLW